MTKQINAIAWTLLIISLALNIGLASGYVSLGNAGLCVPVIGVE